MVRLRPGDAADRAPRDAAGAPAETPPTVPTPFALVCPALALAVSYGRCAELRNTFCAKENKGTASCLLHESRTNTIVRQDVVPDSRRK
jgi:hypothetical protein